MTLTMTDATHGDFKICRPYDYYVNPDSTSALELGTKAHPYKEVWHPFMEMFNFWIDNAQDPVRVLLRQNTTKVHDFFEAHRPIVIVNRGHVIID